MQGTATAAGYNRSGHASRTFDVQTAACSALLTGRGQMVPAPEHLHNRTHTPGCPRIQYSLVLVLVVWLRCSLNASFVSQLPDQTLTCPLHAPRAWKLRRQECRISTTFSKGKLTVHIITLRLLIIRHRQQQRPGVRWAKRPAVEFVAITVNY